MEYGSGISSLWNGFDLLFSIIGDIFNALVMFMDSLQDLIARIDTMTTNMLAGNIDGFPIAQSIATYRYLVGDYVFTLTYLMVVTGCLFVIYKLVRLIKKELFDSFSVTGGGGILSSIKSAFSQ